MLNVISDLKGEEIFWTFYEKRRSQEEFSVEKGIKRKGNTYMLNGKTKIFFNSWIDKKDIV